MPCAPELTVISFAGYAGDVWDPQPPPEDHPWRTMPNHGMTPHYSGTTLDAQVWITSFCHPVSVHYDAI